MAIKWLVTEKAQPFNTSKSPYYDDLAVVVKTRKTGLHLSKKLFDELGGPSRVQIIQGLENGELRFLGIKGTENDDTTTFRVSSRAVNPAKLLKETNLQARQVLFGEFEEDGHLFVIDLKQELLIDPVQND